MVCVHMSIYLTLDRRKLKHENCTCEKAQLDLMSGLATPSLNYFLDSDMLE